MNQRKRKDRWGRREKKKTKDKEWVEKQ
jgi:hypothetical protein